MTTYNIDAKLFGGILLRFRAHNQRELSAFHHTLDATYGLDLDDSNVNFIFENVTTNDLTKILKDAPKLSRIYMTDHIKQKSDTTTRLTMLKVDNLFDGTTLSYKIKNGDICDFS